MAHKNKLHLLIVKVLKCDGHLVFSLLVEDHFEDARVIVDLKQCAHGLLLLRGDSAHYNDLQVSN